MAHRSRLGGFIIDCQTDDTAAAAEFWSRALGFTMDKVYKDGDTEYAALAGTPCGMNVEVQKVSHPSRVHIDIEADDIDAEADRLEALGAKKIAFVKRWWVMEAPTGQRFCIVKMKDPDRGPTPNSWT